MTLYPPSGPGVPAEREAVGEVRRHADLRYGRGLPEGSPAARSIPARVGTVRRLRRASQGENGIGGAAGIKGGFHTI